MKKLLLFFISCFNMVLLAGTKPNAGFIENKGQIHDQNFKPNTAVKYLLSIPGMNIQLKQSSFSYDTYTVEQKSTETNRETVLTKLKHPKVENIYHFHRVDVEFIGANTEPEIVAENPSETYYNYYTTGTSEQGATNVRSYGKVTYKNIYPNIDLEFIAKEGKLKYNFIVHYGGDINVIKWKYYGANNTDIKNDNIIIDVKQGEFNEAIPVSYLLSNRKSKPIKIEFKLVDNGYYCFNLKQQMRLTPDQTLVIDPMPTVLWATYFGGNNSEYIYSSSLDYSANMYVTGYTNSTNNVATVGAFQSSFLGGSQDAILFKFNSLGTLRWATYYGRAGADYGTCVVAGRANNIYFSGWTSSSSAMSTAGSHQPFFGGGSDDGFLAKFDTNGVRIWSTYYGGSGYDDAWACSLDKNDNVYISGTTMSSNGISTPGSHQVSYGGNPEDAYIAKFNSNGIRQWSTYYGSSGDDISFSCVNDVVGNVYFLGVTTSSNNIATPGSHQQTYSKDYDIYLTKLNTNGNRQWSTYYGHDSIDVGLYIHCDTLNSDLYFSGYSKSTTSISTIGAHQSINSGGPNDAILVKFDTSGVRQWATYYGGNDIDWGNAVVTDNSGVYLCGYTTSSVSIATPNALQLNFIGNGGNSDAFIAKFNKAGGRLWGTYYGGTSVDVASSIQLDKLGDIYIAGVTGSGGLATVGSYQSSINGVFDGLCAKFSQSTSLVINESFYENTFLSIFPNPNSGSFTIQTKVDVVLEIVNELGQLVKTIKLDAGNNHQTTITGLADGVYCLKDKLSGTIIKNKIVVVR